MEEKEKIKVSVIKIISMIAILILIVGIVGYITFKQGENYNIKKNVEKEEIIKNTTELAYKQFVATLFNNLKMCQTLPITYDNETINIVAIECLKN